MSRLKMTIETLPRRGRHGFGAPSRENIDGRDAGHLADDTARVDFISAKQKKAAHVIKSYQ